MNSEKIPLKVEIQRMLDLLARQIYQSPLALLRENCQNAYDAILERLAMRQAFEPKIEITIRPDLIEVRDNGIGMTQEQLVQNFWTAGSSGKNTPEARAAGVVGTFGIGAMANFGIAEELRVITRSANGTGGLYSFARRDQLSASENCIEIGAHDTGDVGTTVTAITSPSAVNVAEAARYITDLAQFLAVPVFVNGALVSLKSFDSFVGSPGNAAHTVGSEGTSIGAHMRADVELVLTINGDAWVHLTNMFYSGSPLTGEVFLKQGLAQIRAFRSRFALSAVAASSAYNFGGIADLSNLQPTAGREALTTDSMQFVQSLVSGVDAYVSGVIADTKLADSNSGFHRWVVQHGRYELCSHVTITVFPTGDTLSLGELRSQSETRMFNYYEGSDSAIRDAYGTDEAPLIVPSTANPRRQCQSTYVRTYCKTRHVQESPQVLHVKQPSELTLPESALAFRLQEILQSDYFVSTDVRFGKMSHNLPLLVDTTDGIRITLDGSSGSIATILELYEREFPVFTGMVKDFVRTAIFSKIQNHVPSSTRTGAEAFLNAIRRPREYVEYDMAESEALKSILGQYYDGQLTFTEAANRAAETARVNYQVITVAETKPATSVIGDVIENERRLADTADAEAYLSPLPAITRPELESSARLLTINDGEEPLRSYRLFVAVAERVQRDNAEFFLQPHRTEVVWGGQKVLYIFQHHSGAFALYYEMQSNEVFAEGSGGGAYPTCTIVIKNRVYIPVLENLRSKFLPTAEAKKRFAVRSDLLFPDIS